MRRKADSSANHSAGRVLPDSGLIELDFWEDFNTSNVGRSSTGRDVAVKELEKNNGDVAKESAQAARTLALFSLELSLELALRQSWSLTLRPFGMSCGSLAAELPGTVRLSE